MFVPFMFVLFMFGPFKGGAAGVAVVAAVVLGLVLSPLDFAVAGVGVDVGVGVGVGGCVGVGGGVDGTITLIERQSSEDALCSKGSGSMLKDDGSGMHRSPYSVASLTAPPTSSPTMSVDGGSVQRSAGAKRRTPVGGWA